MNAYLVRGDALAPTSGDLIAQTRLLPVGEPVPDGWRVLSGNERTSEIARVAFRYECEEESEVTSAAPGSPVPVLRQTRTADGASVLVPAFPESADPVLVANTCRACYWHFPATGLYRAFTADETPTAADGQAGYPRLDSIMRLKGEASHYVATACNELGRHKESANGKESI
jgi:hypothetical protein